MGISLLVGDNGHESIEGKHAKECSFPQLAWTLNELMVVM